MAARWKRILISDSNSVFQNGAVRSIPVIMSMCLSFLKRCEERSVHQPRGCSLNRGHISRASLGTLCPTEQRGTWSSARSWDTSFPNPAGHPCTLEEGFQYRYSLYRNFFPFLSLWFCFEGDSGKNLIELSPDRTLILHHSLFCLLLMGQISAIVLKDKWQSFAYTCASKYVCCNFRKSDIRTSHDKTGVD